MCLNALEVRKVNLIFQVLTKFLAIRKFCIISMIFIDSCGYILGMLGSSTKLQNNSPLNLRFDLDKIATEIIFAVTISENPRQQHIKKVGKSR